MPDLNAAELVRQTMEPLRRDVALMQELLERERRMQRDLAGRMLAPVDAVFGLLEESASTMERQAAALESAGAALSEAAALMKAQAQMLERTVVALHQPVRLVKAAAGPPAPGPPGPAARHGRRGGREAPARQDAG